MGTISSVKEYFDTLDERFVSEGAQGVTCVFQYEISGDEGDTFHVNVNDGSMEVVQGAHEAPTATIRMKDQDFVNMVNGKLKGQVAFMTGKLKVAGNIPMATKMQKIFPPNS